MDYLYDIIILTDSRYVAPKVTNDYINNVLLEDGLVEEALRNEGLKVGRTHWDDPEMDWKTVRYALFRTTWDYFDRFEEFWNWVEKVKKETTLINSYEIIKWNSDKHYLQDLERNGVRICPTMYIEPGDQRTLKAIYHESGWTDVILKPAIAGAARHTYKLHSGNLEEHEGIFAQLIDNESMLLQPFQYNVVEKGELSFMVFGGKYSHVVLKIAKPGDFRVQDDFGGTVHDYIPTTEEIRFAEDVVAKCGSDLQPVYARVDVIWDNDNALTVSELELIEPELWFRKYDQAATLFAQALKKTVGYET